MKVLPALSVFNSLSNDTHSTRGRTMQQKYCQKDEDDIENNPKSVNKIIRNQKSLTV